MNLPDPDVYFANVNVQFNKMFPGIPTPQPLDEANEEAVEGLFSEGDGDE